MHIFLYLCTYFNGDTMYIKIKIISAIITIILTFPFHFVYDLFPNVFTVAFFPINESVWEHLKLFITPAIIAYFVELFIMKKKRICIQNNYLALLIEIFSSIGFFMLIFSPVHYLIGENFIFNISLMIISIVLSKYFGYLLIKEKHELLLNIISIPLLLLLIIIMIVYTFKPQKSALFVDPATGESGYKEK